MDGALTTAAGGCAFAADFLRKGEPLEAGRKMLRCSRSGNGIPCRGYGTCCDPNVIRYLQLPPNSNGRFAALDSSLADVFQQRCGG